MVRNVILTEMCCLYEHNQNLRRISKLSEIGLIHSQPQVYVRYSCLYTLLLAIENFMKIIGHCEEADINNTFLSSNITVLKVIMSSKAKQADITAFLTSVVFFKLVFPFSLNTQGKAIIAHITSVIAFTYLML